MRRQRSPKDLLIVLLLSSASMSLAGEDFDDPPIAYSTTQPDNRVSRLQEQLDNHAAELSWDADHGYLESLLRALDVPVESQSLVFSKTSLQLRRISPRTPRAIYFNDDVYVGFCQSGDVLEVSAVDAQLGTVFYTLDQRSTDTEPRFEHRVDNCLVCHSSSRTESVPGHLVRSLYVEESGDPVLSAGSRSVDYTTPFAERWGGWYVTGEHGSLKHLGNLIVEDDARPGQVDNSTGQNVTSLAERFDTTRYLSPHSDIVALMMLEHQVLVHNRITSASYTTRQALAYDDMMNEMLQKPKGTHLDSTIRRIASAGEKLVEALLMVGEAPLGDAVRGTSGFAEAFEAMGPRDSHGRSLRDLDLTRRMFTYPCSYLIYSEAFAELPPEVQDFVWKRLGEVLAGKDPDPKFAHLSFADRKAIREILRETLPELTESWGARQGSVTTKTSG